MIYLVDGLLSFDNITVAGAGGMEAFAAHEEETIEKLSTGVMIHPEWAFLRSRNGTLSARGGRCARNGYAELSLSHVRKVVRVALPHIGMETLYCVNLCIVHEVAVAVVSG